MSASVALALGKAALEADPSGALWWPAESTLVVADLHLGKGSSFAARGVPLPPHDGRLTLERLAAVAARLRPRRVICLGDSFHDAGAAARLTADERQALADLSAGRDWLWVAGNHDPEPAPDIPGQWLAQAEAGGIAFRHEADPVAPGPEVSGHYHPKAAVRVRGRRLAGRCFVTDGRRLILPAFGAYAGGLSVLDPAIAGLLDMHFHVALRIRARLHLLPRAQLSG